MIPHWYSRGESHSPIVGSNAERQNQDKGSGTSETLALVLALELEVNFDKEKSSLEGGADQMGGGGCCHQGQRCLSYPDCPPCKMQRAALAVPPKGHRFLATNVKVAKGKNDYFSKNLSPSGGRQDLALLKSREESG